MTVDDIIDQILEAEGPGDPARNYLAPNDRGGRTNWGISEKAHPEEWADGKVPSKERARAIYAAVYAAPWTSVQDERLRAQLVDMTVLHGQGNTWRILQAAVRPTVTMVDILHMSGNIDFNNSLVAHRCAFMVNIANKDVSQRGNLRGWITRAVRFLL